MLGEGRGQLRAGQGPTSPLVLWEVASVSTAEDGWRQGCGGLGVLSPLGDCCTCWRSVNGWCQSDGQEGGWRSTGKPVEEVVFDRGGRGPRGLGSVEVEGRTQQEAGMEVGGGQCSQDAFEGLKGRSELGRNLIREDRPYAWVLSPALCAQRHAYSCMALGRSSDPGSFILLSVKWGYLKLASWGVAVRIRWIIHQQPGLGDAPYLLAVVIAISLKPQGRPGDR